ncbi:MAG: AmmeMemoRadiSam system radical SAM enzyme [Planctomycetes bacterium]|nr:AmmeMemoRadiSam system radical SAM enzyme [Planctomycetota bacterium]
MTTVQCELCPKNCRIASGQSGECLIRVNIEGRLTAVTYGHPCAVHVDPVEKKPLFHFLPATSILSLATVGCNLHCKNCQNWEISQENPENAPASHLLPDAVVALARRYRCPSIAYTYTEPVVFFEYTYDTCVKGREAGLRNVLVTAGYINPAPAEKLYRVVDAANIDLKAMSDSFYRDVCGGTLAPVLNTLVLARSLGVLVEVTNLVIPTLNDSDRDLRALARWVAENLGRETPLHFSRFIPHHRMQNLPTTPAATLDRARAIAVAEGLPFVYIGNIHRPAGSNTCCPSCGKRLVERVGYRVLEMRVKSGRCPDCGQTIHGIWP